MDIRRKISSTVPFFLLYVIAYGVVLTIFPPTPGQMNVADPLVQWLFPLGGVWFVPALSIALALPWLVMSHPSRSDLRTALFYSLAGLSVASVATGAIRLVGGPSLPSFVPPEESAAPGLALGLGAGIIEEALFRFAILPLTYLLVQRKTGRAAATMTAIFVTGLLFAVSHEFGPGAVEFNRVYFATRVLIPGMAMSMVYLLVHPAFMVSAHCAAHIAIYWLFVGAAP